MDKISVGIIGASTSGWAAMAHVPALKALPDYQLRAVSTTRRESAEQAAQLFGVPHAFASSEALLAHPRIDLVVVAVRVQAHYTLVRAALEAGKAVYCEWPLGLSLEESTDLETRAREAGVRTVIGLQGRNAPEVRYVRDLISKGYVGDVLSTILIGSGVGWGPVTDRGHAYLFDAANGATTLSVTGMHALDTLTFVLGDLSAVGASLVVGRSTVRLTDAGEDTADEIRVTAPDQVSLSGRLAGGGALTAFFRGAHSRAENLLWEINGTEGDLVVSTTGINGNLQTAQLNVRGGRGDETTVMDLALPAHYGNPATRDLPAPVRNVAETYVRLADDLRDGTETVPGFAHAVRQHRFLDAIERSSRTGMFQTLT
jgi:predicted dehydrogenase